MLINMDKKEFIDPHKSASGLKLWEVLASATPLRVMGFLLRYGGKWAGDRVIIEGDYDDKLNLYELCSDPKELADINEWRVKEGKEPYKASDLYKDITDEVLPEYNAFIEIPEYQVDIKTTGWRETMEKEEIPAMKPDMVISTGGKT